MDTLCKRCGLTILIKSKDLKCNTCKGVYHLDCTNVSFKRYCLMTKEKKLNWKCEQCYELQKNETLTKINVSTKNSFEALSDDDNSDFLSISQNSRLNSSCPDLTKINMEERIEDLEKLNITLREKLDSAENEIENLLLENTKLKKIISDQHLKTKLLTDICSSSTKKNITYRKKQKDLNKTKLNFSQDEMIEQSATHTQMTCCHSPAPAPPAQSDKMEGSHPRTASRLESQVNKSNINKSLKRKLTIISSNNKNNILKIAENETYLEDFHIFHHVTSGCGVLKLLKYLEKEAQRLTHTDYCVLFIGEHDFGRSADYVNIIQCIRQSLSKIENTNIIISAPTYICGLELYNCRVELFNSLLCLDVYTHNHAYLYGSNLTLSMNMFSVLTGKLNDIGMRDVIRGIRELIIWADKNYSPHHTTFEGETQTESISCNNNATKSSNLFRF